VLQKCNFPIVSVEAEFVKLARKGGGAAAEFPIVKTESLVHELNYGNPKEVETCKLLS
jgi:hypothetical protein